MIRYVSYRNMVSGYGGPMQPSAPPRRGGRPRNARIDSAVRAATSEILDESGYANLTLTEVARRADTTTAAIYRRWSTRQHLALDALAQRLGQVQAPDTGCTICDLNECINVFVVAFDKLAPDILGPLLADCADHPELRKIFTEALLAPPRSAVERTLAAATARGDLRADARPELIVDLLGALIHYRALFGGESMTELEIEQTVETLLQGTATDYPALLEHSRAITSESPVHQLHQ